MPRKNLALVGQGIVQGLFASLLSSTEDFMSTDSIPTEDHFLQCTSPGTDKVFILGVSSLLLILYFLVVHIHPYLSYVLLHISILRHLRYKGGNFIL